MYNCRRVALFKSKVNKKSFKMLDLFKNSARAKPKNTPKKRRLKFVI